MSQEVVGFILQPTYRIESGRAVVCLYGTLEGGGSFLVRDRRHVPGFYVRLVDAGRARDLGARPLDPSPMTTLAGEPVAHAMAEVERWQTLVPELRIFGLSLDGDGQTTPLVRHDLLDWAAERTASQSRSAADTGALLAATDELFAAMTCQP